MKNNKILFLLTLTLTLTLSSCGTAKKVPVTNTEDVEAVLKKTNEAQTRFDAVINNASVFDNFQAKVKYTVDGKSLNGKLYVEHGKRLCITLNILGIEVARVEVDTEKVTFVDKYDKVFTILPIKEFVTQFGMAEEMQYDAVECLLLGRIFAPGSGIATSQDFKNFRWDIDETGLLSGVLTKPRYQLTYTMDADNILKETRTDIVSDTNNGYVECKYSGNMAFENGVIPGNIYLHMHGDGKELEADIKVSNPIKPTHTWTSFRPSEGFNEISFDELLEILSKL